MFARVPDKNKTGEEAHACTESKSNENLGSLCPICQKGHIDEVTHICSTCKINFVEFNLARHSALLDYRGQGMSTHAGIIAALSFGLFSVAQILLKKDLPFITFIIFFILFVGFQLFGFYEIFRLTEYRKSGRWHEMVISDWNALSTVEDTKLGTLIKEKKKSTRAKSKLKYKYKRERFNKIFQCLIRFIRNRIEIKESINKYYTLFIIIIDITVILYRIWF